MNKILFLSVFSFLFPLSVLAQGNFFVRGYVGGNTTNEMFSCLDLNMEFGYNYKGIDVALGFGHYSNTWGKNKYNFFDVLKHEDTTNLFYTGDASSNENAMSISMVVGYDVLRLLKLESHHLYPFVGLGYCNMTRTKHNADSNKEKEIVNMSEHVLNGVDPIFGIRYEYDIIPNFSVGAYYKMSVKILESDGLGMTLKYTM